MLGYVVREIVNLFYNFLKCRYPYLRKQQIMRRFLNAKKVDRNLVQKVLVFYEYLWFEERLLRDGDLSKVLGKLPVQLRSELMHLTFSSYLSVSPYFTGLPHDLYE